MGLLDSVLGAALGGGQQQQQGGGLMGSLGSAVLGSLLSGGNQQQGASMLGNVLNSVGGIGGLVNAMSQAGLGQQVNSWIGNGPNQAVTGDQLQSALGSDMIANIAQHMGVAPGQASGVLAQMLPELINHLTPNGQMPTGGVATGQANASDLIGMLGGLLGGQR